MDIGSFKDRTKSSTTELFRAFGDNVILLKLMYSLLFAANIRLNFVSVPVIRFLSLGYALISPLEATHF